MRWRSITLEYAVFWTTIAFSTSRRSIIRCARLFLSRSKAAMLSVHIWDAGSTGDLETAQASRKLLELIVSQTHRILSCELSSTSPEFWRYWIHPAPNLRRLVTKGQGPEIPPIFNEEIPRLETFTTHYYVPWPLGVYASLREVDLWNNNQTVTLLSLLDGLRGCKNLERLTLHGYTCLDRGGPPPATVSLPCLRQLDIFSSDSALILEHLDAPSLTGPVINASSSTRIPTIIFSPRCPELSSIHHISRALRNSTLFSTLARRSTMWQDSVKMGVPPFTSEPVGLVTG